MLSSLFDHVFIESHLFWYGKMIVLKNISFTHILKRFVLRYTTVSLPGVPCPRPRRRNPTLNLQGLRLFSCSTLWLPSGQGSQLDSKYIQCVKIVYLVGGFNPSEKY